jgi:hypothetical protein
MMKITSRFELHDKKVEKAFERAQHKVLRRCGAYVRKIARDFVKHRSDPNKHSEKLHSPYDHFGLKRSIIFDTDENAAYIGPRYIKRGLANVARLHEFGGQAIVKDIDPDLWHGVKIGSVAPVTLPNAAKKDKAIRHEARVDPKTGRKIVWIKIRTKRQAEHSTRLYHRFMAKNAGSILVRYAPRPYMVPALMKSLPHLSPMWKNSLRNV